MYQTPKGNRHNRKAIDTAESETEGTEEEVKSWGLALKVPNLII